jgi:hypothetical protein
MYEKPARRRSEYHDRNDHPLRRPPSSDGDHEDDAARLPTRASKRLRIDNTHSSSHSSPIAIRSSDFSKEQHPHRRSFSSSRTVAPRPYSSRPSRLSVSYHDTQQQKDPRIVESIVERLRMYTAKRLNDIKERLRVWEANGMHSFSHIV